MRSLLVAPALPSDAGNGLAMRIGVFLEALRRLGEVDVIVLPVFGDTETTNPLCERLGVHPKLVPVSGRVATEFLLLRNIADPEARLDAFVRYGRPTLSAYLAMPVLQEIREFVTGRSFDLVHIARSYLLPVAGAWPENRRPSISVDLDEDDVETYRRLAKLHALRGDLFTGRWLEAEAAAFEKLIMEWLPNADVAFVSTESERDEITTRYGDIPAIVAPNVVALPPAATYRPSGCALLFVGGFGYFPNLDAALWVLESVLPPLMARSPEPVSMTMVGRNPPQRLKALADALGVTLLDTVDDLAPIYARSSVALVPLRAAGGSRIKLLEAAAHGVPVVATSMGAENSGLKDGREIWIADTPDAIVDACLAILRDSKEAGRRAKAAKAFVETFRSRTAMISTLTDHFAINLTAHQAKHRGDLR